MTQSEIEQIKKKGIERSLREAIENRLWDAKRKVEKAGSENLKHFLVNIFDIKALIEETEQLYKELKKD